ncbi:MAG: hypothetical protein JW795_07340 [Chitinivibrionales bacterium]|nr:hypothetical protein [Chitinivibrionales bacterium]
MATDYSRIAHDLITFYDFNDKRVVHVGAGGDGKLMAYVDEAKNVIAIDTNSGAMTLLQKTIEERSWQKKVSAITGDFFSLHYTVDVVLFEFCFHELRDPILGIDHAKAMAPDVVIIDHVPSSPWSGYAGETEKITNSWKVINNRTVRQYQPFSIEHTFKNFEELQIKFSVAGEAALSRIKVFEGHQDITIPMPYGIVLL